MHSISQRNTSFYILFLHTGKKSKTNPKNKLLHRRFYCFLRGIFLFGHEKRYKSWEVPTLEQQLPDK